MDQINNEKRTRNFIITNSIVNLISRTPEIAASTIYIILYYTNDGIDNLSLNSYINIGQLNDIFDFIFCLNGAFQFILFYKFNNKFRDGVKIAFGRNIILNSKKQNHL